MGRSVKVGRTRVRTGVVGEHRVALLPTYTLPVVLAPRSIGSTSTVDYAVCQHPTTSDLTTHVSPLPKEDLYRSERAFTAGLTVKV